MTYDPEGQPKVKGLATYRVPRIKVVPVMDVYFVQTNEPTGPFGAKSVSEIAIDGTAPAIASAIHNATGIWMRQLPYTPERVLKNLKENTK
ncbi:hypothetical protein SDC9_193814 [bioreactor metagenome]|uniref:Uncharacterized protein n=1 Tax=bioreactor metagenome TaxID=1076179 RepID=A0A645I4L1_9ZZZZ